MLPLSLLSSPSSSLSKEDQCESKFHPTRKKGREGEGGKNEAGRGEENDQIIASFAITFFLSFPLLCPRSLSVVAGKKYATPSPPVLFLFSTLFQDDLRWNFALLSFFFFFGCLTGWMEKEEQATLHPRVKGGSTDRVG